MATNDITTKLLANEDITIIRANSSTASFDVKSRVLTLPQWTNMSVELEDMLKAHEVGHALFTVGDEWLAACEKQPTLKGYINVVEDARVEKLMKRRYPGIRKTFFVGYQELLEKDFFKIQSKDVNEMLLIDRINLYFKTGLSTGVKFSEKEQEFVERIDTVETLSDVVTLAKELLEFTKEELENERKEQLQVQSEQQSDNAEIESDESSNSIELDDQELNEEQEQELSGEFESDPISDEELESETDRALNSMLNNMADTKNEYRTYEFETSLGNDPIVSYKTIIGETKSAEFNPVLFSADVVAYQKTQYNNFMKDSERIVSYLVKEFEMRKSASAYKRAQVSKSGSLDCNKLYAYTMVDDIFKKITVLPNGKNHGMVFLLDWSGSMTSVIDSTIKQLINLVMFCRRINIPFEVFAFSSEYIRQHKEQYLNAKALADNLHQTTNRNIIFSDGMFSLLNFFSSKMTNSEFNTMARRLLNGRMQYVKGYHLSATPLNDALLHMLDFIPKFKKANNIEKLTLITLTDGEGADLKAVKYLTGSAFVPGSYSRIAVTNTVNDPKTHRSYKLDNYNKNFSCNTTKTLLEMLKHRYDINTIGFYICKNSIREIGDAVSANAGTRITNSLIEAIRADFKANGFFSIPNTGRDELFLIPDSSTKIIDKELDIDGDASAAKIARQMSKMFNTKKHSRILLDKFIGYVA